MVGIKTKQEMLAKVLGRRRAQTQFERLRASRCRSQNLNEQVAAAQVRVMKFEAAIQVVGEDDPVAMGLKEALQKARVQAQLRPVQDRISHTERP